MQINPIKLKNLDQLIKDYRHDNNKIMRYFDYHPFNDYQQRVQDLKDREFNREQLTNALYQLNKEWHAPQSTYQNIKRLKSNDSVVVIGGQQAGLLTGPLYTVNKIISIIQLAKQQEEALGVPVIPVFWIAGEDHDFDEINHIYNLEASGMIQHKTRQRVVDKRSISNITIDQKETKSWLNNIFTELAETTFTKSIYEVVEQSLALSKTYVDFFARLIFQLFEKDGLVLMDSGSKYIREIERDYFIKMIENQSDISTSVYQSYQKLSQEGYSVMLDVEKNDAHLFYQKDNERILLEKNVHDEWIGKQNEVKLTTDELIDVAKETPYLLSNNVVSRPLMQELLFPTLAFVGGNGEISYWAVLRSAFQAIGLKMPPVVPRLSFTYINPTTLKLMNKFSLSSEDVLGNRIGEKKGNWLAAQHHPPIKWMVDQLKQTIDRAHAPLRSVAQELRTDLGDLADKNLVYLYQNIDYLEKKMVATLEEKFTKELADFELIDDTLNPLGVLQERIWNPLPLLNQYGLSVFEKVVQQSCCFEQEHFLVYV